MSGGEPEASLHRRYRVALNVELTNLCNARCAMCPREAIPRLGVMPLPILARLLDHVEAARGRVHFLSLCGFGEAVISPNFHDALALLRQRKPRLGAKLTLVTNGRGLNETRLNALDGVIDELKISFSSLDPGVYARLHCGLDFQETLARITLACRTLRQTSLTMHLTPSPLILPGLARTVRHWRAQGIGRFVLLPIAFNRAGRLDAPDLHAQWRWLWLQRWRLGITGLDRVMVQSLAHALALRRANAFGCFGRNCTLAVNHRGQYLYCFNDIASSHPIGEVESLSIDEVLARRDAMGPSDALCRGCNYAPKRVRAGRGSFEPAPPSDSIQPVPGYTPLTRSAVTRCAVGPGPAPTPSPEPEPLC